MSHPGYQNPVSHRLTRTVGKNGQFPNLNEALRWAEHHRTVAGGEIVLELLEAQTVGDDNARAYSGPAIGSQPPVESVYAFQNLNLTIAGNVSTPVAITAHASLDATEVEESAILGSLFTVLGGGTLSLVGVAIDLTGNADAEYFHGLMSVGAGSDIHLISSTMTGIADANSNVGVSALNGGHAYLFESTVSAFDNKYNAATGRIDITEAAQHGAGAIGTAVAPKTTRVIENGIIMTEILVDATGLASVATANDVIGLAAGGNAYIGRNVIADNGVIFKNELSCLETPVGGDNDVNVVANASGTLAYDGAGGTTYLSDSGDLLAGQTIQNLTPGLTANHYYYLTAGTGDTAGTYTAGQWALRTWGRQLIS